VTLYILVFRRSPEPITDKRGAQKEIHHNLQFIQELKFVYLQFSNKESDAQLTLLVKIYSNGIIPPAYADRDHAKERLE